MSDAKFSRRDTASLLGIHAPPDCQDVGFARFGRCQTCGGVRRVVRFDKFVDDGYVPVRIFIGKILVQFIAYPLRAFDDRALEVGISSLEIEFPRLSTCPESSYLRTSSLYAPRRVAL